MSTNPQISQHDWNNQSTFYDLEFLSLNVDFNHVLSSFENFNHVLASFEKDLST